jgi:hypothetical protein
MGVWMYGCMTHGVWRMVYMPVRCTVPDVGNELLLHLLGCYTQMITYRSEGPPRLCNIFGERQQQKLTRGVCGHPTPEVHDICAGTDCIHCVFSYREIILR